jgi:SAM-dependent methyltransferase
VFRKPEVIEFKVGSPLTQPPVSPSVITDPQILYDAMMGRFNSRIYARGEISLPAIPSLVDYYLEGLDQIFTSLGKQFSEEEIQQLRHNLISQLEQGFRASPHSYIVLRYDPSDNGGISYNISTVVSTMAEQYNSWLSTRQTPLFGSQPDAKLIEVVKQIPGRPQDIAVLDIGAGTGRNTLPLARMGYAVDALELTPAFADQIKEAAQAENLAIRVYNADILSPLARMAPAYYSLIFASEVVSHFRTADEIRLLLAKVCDGLHSGGGFLFNTFVAIDGYEPDQMTRELSQINWSTIFTRRDIQTAMDGLPLTLIEEVPVYDYEKSHTPPEAWPPTGWFENWSLGRDLFWLPDHRPPMELRWLVCRRL